MNFERHWKNIDGTLRLSIGNGLIKASIFYTCMIPKGDINNIQATVNDISIGRFENRDVAKDAIEQNITNRIIKALNQVGYGVKGASD